MNTYQFTAVPTRRVPGAVQRIVEPVDAGSLEEGRERFRAAHPESEWTITGEELIHTGTSEEPNDAPEELELSPVEAGRKLLDATERLQELGRLVSTLKEERAALEEGQVELQSTLRQARQELAQAQELAEEQAVRAERAEDEVIRLKAKLYDYMAAPQ